MKVGDKVRILNPVTTAEPEDGGHVVGDIGVVREIDKDDGIIVFVERANDWWFYNEKELELVEEVPQDSLWVREEEKVIAKALGRKDDDGKTRFELLDPAFLEEVAKVLTFGANKYGDENWKDVKPLRERYIGAFMRHMNAWQQGQELDNGPKGSGLPHLAHAACCLMFLRWKERENANS